MTSSSTKKRIFLPFSVVVKKVLHDVTVQSDPAAIEALAHAGRVALGLEESQQAVLGVDGSVVRLGLEELEQVQRLLTAAGRKSALGYVPGAVRIVLRLIRYLSKQKQKV